MSKCQCGTENPVRKSAVDPNELFFRCSDKKCKISPRGYLIHNDGSIEPLGVLFDFVPPGFRPSVSLLKQWAR